MNDKCSDLALKSARWSTFVFAALLSAVVTLACGGDKKAGGMPSELSAVSSHLTFVSSFESPDHQLVSNYRVDEPFDTFLTELKPQLINGGWYESPTGVTSAWEGGDREVDFIINPPEGQDGATALMDIYKLRDIVGGGPDNKKKGVMLYHFAAAKQE